MIKPMDVTPEIVLALAEIRLYAAGQNRDIRHALNTLDNAGVFAEIDEHNEYASAEEILAESAAMTLAPELDPAEWGDTTREDIARRQDLIEYTPYPSDPDRVRRSFGSLSADND
jgi:hypothetical protein